MGEKSANVARRIRGEATSVAHLLGVSFKNETMTKKTSHFFYSRNESPRVRSSMTKTYKTLDDGFPFLLLSSCFFESNNKNKKSHTRNDCQTSLNAFSFFLSFSCCTTKPKIERERRLKNGNQDRSTVHVLKKYCACQKNCTKHPEENSSRKLSSTILHKHLFARFSTLPQSNRCR